MKSFFLYVLIVVGISCIGFKKASAQVGIGTTTPSPNAVLELKSPGNNQGFLVPRMTTAQRTAAAFTSSLTSAELGLLVFDTDTGKFYYWGGTAWIVIEDSTGTDSQTLSFTTGNLSISGGNTVLITGTVPGGTAGGDLSGTYPNPAVANNAITSAKISDGTIATGDLADGSVTSTKVLDGTIVTGDLADGSVTSAKVLDGTITSIDITDATIATADIANSAVTDAKIGTGITVSKLSASATAGQVLTTVGTTTTWSTLPDASATNEIQDLSLATNTLSLSGDASPVNLAPYLDNTDSQNLTLGTRTGTQQPVNISGGTGITIDVADNDNSITNEIQDLSLATNTLSLSGDASTVNLAPYLDNTDAQTLTFSSPSITISGGNSINISAINTDSQDLTLTSNTLSLTGDATTVSLAPYLDNTDSQDLTLTSNTLSLTGDATTVSLAPYLDNTDSQDLTLTSNTLSLTGDASTVNLAPYLDNTDAQTLTFTPATSSLVISGGNTVTVTATGTAGGDLNGSYPNPTVDGLQGRGVSNALPSTGQVLEWTGTQWAPGTDDQGGGGVGGSGTAGQVAYWSGGTSIAGNNGLQYDEKNAMLGVNITPKANLHFSGSHAVTFTVASGGPYTVKPTDYVIICDPETTDVLLPDAAELSGRILIIRSTDPKDVFIRSASGKDTIDKLSNLQIADRGDGTLYAVTLISNGVDQWMTITRSVK